ncbi:glycosyltransferase involved in cell wall biosynthesis [Streptomyces avidinii]|uniref:glycosyltransferase family 4 protein n=1 Tax=Streptomyces TaxID=1883 RepID=UPI000BC88427|nr:glycosyltransferase family 4 protein [[Kitasatospora] papulosa]RAS27962.1 glycosyltransferase involved in cell wall biosynthesis [Streptomyces avidinii]WSK31202.1 glycosyltransferase family 4 protein [[Kitasatospora] papulosa]SNX79255.1 Glycosyltransferase involved in cell wall bisynthesis [Streptomyces microflavus]
MSQLRTVQVLGGGAGSSARVSSLAAGLVARGVQVTVCAPAGSGHAHGLPASGTRFVAVPRRSDPAAVAALRTACAGADIVHAHGLHAAVRAGIALSGQGTPLVVTWHTRAHAEGARGRLLRMLERKAARAAAVVLGTSWELVDRARRRGARDARLAPAAVPASRVTVSPDDGKVRAELGAFGRPLLVSVAQRDHDALLDAVRGWRALDPAPLLAVVGEGHRTGALSRRIAAEGLPVVLAGGPEDIGDLLAAADIAVLSGRGDGGPLLAHEALRLGIPLVAARTDGLPELVGDAAELVPPGDAEALSEAVVRLLADPGRRQRLAEAGRAQAAGWPTEDDTIAHVLSVYDELATPVAAG